MKAILINSKNFCNKPYARCINLIYWKHNQSSFNLGVKGQFKANTNIPASSYLSFSCGFSRMNMLTKQSLKK